MNNLTPITGCMKHVGAARSTDTTKSNVTAAQAHEAKKVASTLEHHQVSSCRAKKKCHEKAFGHCSEGKGVKRKYEKAFSHYLESERIKRQKIQSDPFSESLKVKENTHTFATLEKDADNTSDQTINSCSGCSISHCYINELPHELIWKISMYLCDGYNDFTDFKNMSRTCKNILYIISKNLMITNKVLNRWKNNSIEERKKLEFNIKKFSFLYQPTFAINKYNHHMSNGSLSISSIFYRKVELLKNKNIAFIDRNSLNTIKIWKFIDPNTYKLVDILNDHASEISAFKELNDNRLISIDNNVVKIWNPGTTNKYTCESTYLSSMKSREVNKIREMKNGIIIITTVYQSGDTFQIWDLNKSKNNEIIHARTFNNSDKTINRIIGSRIEAFKELSNSIACSTHTSGLINLWDFTKNGNDACIACFGQDNLWGRPQTLISELKDNSLATVEDFTNTNIWEKSGSSYTKTQTIYSNGVVFSITPTGNGSIVINYKTGIMEIWTKIAGGPYECVQELKTLKPSFILKLRSNRLVIIDEKSTIEAYVQNNNEYIKESAVMINENTSTNNITHKAIGFYYHNDISIIDMAGMGITCVIPQELKPLIKFSEDPEN